MTTNFARLAFALALLSMGAACGDDEDESPNDRNVEVATEGVQGGIGDVPLDEASCRRFCEKTNECARAEGRPIPPEAADCAQSCQPGGIHRQAPAAIHACAAEACGPAFLECSRRAMLAHMRDRDVAVFPPVCQGLCEKAAYCARRSNAALGPGEDDCEAACRVGGPYAEVPEREVLCVHQPCGPPFAACRQAGGPSGSPDNPQAPRVPPPRDSP